MAQKKPDQISQSVIPSLSTLLCSKLSTAAHTHTRTHAHTQQPQPPSSEVSTRSEVLLAACLLAASQVIESWSLSVTPSSTFSHLPKRHRAAADKSTFTTVGFMQKGTLIFLSLLLLLSRHTVRRASFLLLLLARKYLLSLSSVKQPLEGGCASIVSFWPSPPGASLFFARDKKDSTRAAAEPETPPSWPPFFFFFLFLFLFLGAAGALLACFACLLALLYLALLYLALPCLAWGEGGICAP